MDIPASPWNQRHLIGKDEVMALSFEEAFEAEFAPLHRYLRRRVGESTADDLAAQTFATAYAGWERFDPSRPLRPWLYGIAANLLRHHWRSERRMLRAYARTGVDPVVTDDGETVERLDADAQHRLLAAALAELRPHDREILLLHAWAELSDTEIGAALSLPTGTVKSRLHRTRERLRNHLDRHGQVAARPSSSPAEDPR
ncbi:MAG TPA: RNA polymerase sigma factor [Gaiella sp.]|nr:RNA polymerase sigma factor [Gaiella sp.]